MRNGIGNRINSASVTELLELRQKIARVLETKRDQLRRDLALLDAGTNREALEPRKRGVRPGTKFAPKFRSPQGELWTGRGHYPRWLRAQIARGREASDFLIEPIEND